MRATVMAVLFGIGLAGPVLAQPAAAVSRQELRQGADLIAKQYDEAYNAKSASAMAALYAPNGVLVPPGRPPVEGRQAIMVYYQGRFDHGIGGHVTRIDQVHPLGDGGFAVGRFSIQAPGPNGTRREVHGNLVYVLERMPRGWKLRLVMASPVPGR